MIRQVSIFLFLFPFVVFSQNHAIYSFDQFEKIEYENHLNIQTVGDMEEDRDGFLWLASETGIYRFDGDRFMHFSLLSEKGEQLGETVGQISLLNQDTMLVISNHGLGIINTKSFEFDTRFFNSESQDYYLEDNFIRGIILGKDKTVWVFTKTAIHLLDKNLDKIGSVELEKHPNIINANPTIPTCFVVNKTQLVVHMPLKSGAASGNNWQLVDIAKKTMSSTEVPEFSPFERVRISQINSESYLLIAKEQGIKNLTFHYFDPSNKQLKKLIDYCSSDKRNTTATIQMDRIEQGIAFTEYKTGYFFDPISKSILEEYKNFKPYSHFLKMTNGAVYVGNSEGLFRLTQSNKTIQKFPSFENHFEENEFNDYAMDFVKLEKKLLIGTHGRHLLEYDSITKAVRQIQVSEKVSSSMVWNMRRVNANEIWIGTQTGLFVYNIKEEKGVQWKHANMPAGMRNSPITTQFVDSKGLVWMGIGAGNGLVVYDPKTDVLESYSFDKNKFPLRSITGIAEDKDGNVWLGNQTGGGLIKWNRKTKTFTKLNINKESKFVTDFIEDLLVDSDNELWIGTRSGLYNYSIDKNRFKRYSTKDGLISNYITSLCEDQSKNIWVGTTKGVNVLENDGERIWDYTKKKGIPGNEIVTLKRWNQNSLFIGASDGFCLIDAGQLVIKEEALTFYFEPIRVNGALLNFEMDKTVELGYEQNNLSINFGVVNHQKEGTNKYYYRLLNVDSSWTSLKTGELQLIGLASGNYELQLKVCVSGTNCIESEILYFNIQTPFWKSWWFIVLLILGAFGLTTLFFRIRISNLKRVEDVRRQISADLHDDVGASISSVRILSEILTGEDIEAEGKRKIINSIKEQSSHISETLEENIWNINPKNNRLSILISRMQQHANETLENAGINLKWHVSIQNENLTIDADRRKELYLFFKEAINNIVKHSNCTHTTIQIDSDKRNITLAINDDGIGYDTTKSYSSNGLVTMSNRAETLNATLSMISSEGNGTRIHFKCSI